MQGVCWRSVFNIPVWPSIEFCVLSVGIAIFCMLLTYYMWIKAVKTGSIYWAAKCALAYFYMVTLHSLLPGVSLCLHTCWDLLM